MPLRTSALVATFFSLLFSFLVFNVENANAQQTITGRLVDAESGEALVSATVEVKNRLQGTIVNLDGRYEITVDQLPATLIYRFIGFQSVEKQFTNAGPFEFDVALKPVRIELDAVTVTGENPAIAIMRKVIERKQRQRENLQTWKSKAYSRFVASNDTGIVAITEGVSDAYWSKTDGLKEVSKGVRKTDNVAFIDMMPAALTMQDMYDDNIDIGGFEFPGITHPNAFKYYQFALEGRRYRDEEIVYDISIKPKSDLRPGFIGTVSVLDDVYAMLRVELVPNKAFFFPTPIKEFEIEYSQQFSNFGGEYWLPIDFVSEGTIKIGIPGLTVPDINFTQLSRMTDYQTEISIPDSIRNSNKLIIVDSLSLKTEKEFAARDIVPLTAREVEAYEGIDSTMSVADSFQPTGFFSRWINSSADESGASIGSGPSKRKYWSLTPKPAFDRVRGYSLGGELGISPSDYLETEGEVAYNTGPESVSYRLGIGGQIPFAKRFSWKANYFDGYGTVGRTEKYPPIFSSVFALAFGHDYYDYYESVGFSVSGEWRAPWPYGKALIEFTSESIEPATVFHFGSPIVVNRYFYGTDLLQGSDQNRLRIGYESGPVLEFSGNKRLAVFLESGSVDKGPLGTSSYSSIEGELDWRIPTFLSRRFIPMSLDIALRASYSTEDTPLNRQGVLDSRLGVLAPTATLRTGRNKPLYARKTVGLFVEHNFRTVLFEILGLSKLVEDGTSIQLFGAAVRGFDPSYGETFSCQDYDCDDFFLTSEFDQSEIGISLSNILELPIRLDYTVRLDDNYNLFDSKNDEVEFLRAAKRKRHYFTIGISRVF